jgi:hypothetical protein
MPSLQHRVFVWGLKVNRLKVRKLFENFQPSTETRESPSSADGFS